MTMDGLCSVVVTDEQPDPPARVYERLRQIAGYTWDESQRPYHSTYDNWHIVGKRFVSPYSNVPSTTPPYRLSSPPAFANRISSVSSASLQNDGNHDQLTTVPPPTAATRSSSTDAAYVKEQSVVARVSHHVLREERTFHTCKNVIANTDPEGEHNVKPVDLIRLAPQPGDKGPIVVAIYEYLGMSDLLRFMEMGPAFFYAQKIDDKWEATRQEFFRLEDPISLLHFLDFAIGATQCLEILHHRHGIVHGEIRADAFHYDMQTRKVKLTSFGSGVRSLEHGLTSTGWSTLSKELGAKHKLLYISPEQTGRMPAEPDTRTDIYSLGVVFWHLLTQQPVFSGATPLDIVQCVLSRRISLVSNVRMDVPEVLGKIIQKCTAKNIQDRYHSVSGLRYDLQRVQSFLVEGDRIGLSEWSIGSKDVSSFFILPTNLIGREAEKEQLVRVIERVANSHQTGNPALTSRVLDLSAMSHDLLDLADASSEGASSVEGGYNTRSGSFTPNLCSDPRQSKSSLQPLVNAIGSDALSGLTDTMNLTRMTKTWERHQSVTADSRSLVDGNPERQNSSRHSVVDGGSNVATRPLGSTKFKRHGQCEVVTVEGAAGMGKSFLVQQVLADVRRKGYFASSKFDTARRIAFGPLLRLLSSLFKQVWGERNTETPLHSALKDYVRPIWPTLHTFLGLPEFLISPPEAHPSRSPSLALSPSKPRNIRAPNKRRTSSPGKTPPGISPGMSPNSMFPRSPRISSQPSQDFLRTGGSSKTIRLMNMFLDILRIFTTYNFICFCLDDLHFADDESLELITQMITARLRMVLIVTFRPDEISCDKIQRTLQPTENDLDQRTWAGSGITRICLPPLTEQDIMQYVSSTLLRPVDEVVPLALVIQAKTAGNPFYIREMLSACHRSKSIWYDYLESRWTYEMDKLFDQFKGQHNYDVLDDDFVTRRLVELPLAARSILAWASLVGTSFSFEFICQLLSGEFEYIDDCKHSDTCHVVTKITKNDAVEGLQAAVSACILVQGETDDRFRFTHDRYIQSASSLKECNKRMMHFIIAQTLLKYYCTEARSRDNTAAHICEAVDIIKERVDNKKPYRQLLKDCAASALQNGARHTACKYYMSAIALLQAHPWDPERGGEETSFDETSQLHLRSAESQIYMGNHTAAHALLDTVISNARSADDKAPAWLLQSRILAQTGDSDAALVLMKESLEQLQVVFDDQPTYEKCDAEFKRLLEMIKSRNRTDQLALGESDPTLAIVGSMLGEACSAAWWSNCLEFYNLALVMMRTHLDKGAFPQSSMAFLYVAQIALARFNMVEFGVELGNISVELLDRQKDPFSSARGYMVYGNLVSHVQTPISTAITHLESAVDFAAGVGDRISIVLSFGMSAMMRFWCVNSFADLEGITAYPCEEVPGWTKDTRGACFLISVRQVCKAFQGKTRATDPMTVMSDDEFSTATYKAWLEKSTRNGGRSLLIFESMEIIPLFVYGHYEAACDVGRRCLDNIESLWSSRNSRAIMLFHGLSLAALMFQKIGDPRRTGDLKNETHEQISQLEGLSQKIKDWQIVSDVNYLVWSLWLDAQISELRAEHGLAISQYETALDHASEHKYVFEEALGNSLMAGFFIRNSARRSARAVLRESLALWQQLGAFGVTQYMEDEHSLLLHSPTQTLRTVDAAAQTDFAGDTASVAYPETEETRAAVPTPTAESKESRMAAWRGSMQASEPGAGLPPLDMIDLHAILMSSQVISSVLQVDILLKTMCDVILQTCGGSATQAAIVIQDDDSEEEEWCIAASGEPEKGATAHMPGQPLDGTSRVAENVVLYCVRFREAVFISDLLNDERFGNVSDAWLQANPTSKAVIAIPICHGQKPLLGVLYLEGEPDAFTDRHVTVLQLLVLQIGISYSNALSMKSIEKVSAENVSMVEVQKQALAQALEAETKAKTAEATAVRNVKIAEEAVKAKSIFLANVSHELRTPLNGVIGNSELLKDSLLNKDQMEMADSIRVSADLLLTVINDILDFSKMEADKMKLYIIAFNPQEMVREVVRAVSYSNREKTSTKNVRIIQDINLPPMLIYGDPVRLHQVLGNLISNSLKFTTEGTITIGARVDSDTLENTKLTFWVKDTGIGIPEAQLTKLFKPFSQADASTARKYGGSGLGLSICKSLIETMMKGKIELDSEENVGTTAWFTATFDKAKPEVSAGDAQTVNLPQIVDRQAEAMPSPHREPSPNPFLDLTQVPKDQIRICVAEDNLINQRIAIQYARKLGYKYVDAYENGLKAVEGLRDQAKANKPYHIVLMDCQMPLCDGYQATSLIRKDPIEIVRKVVVIAMTASAIQGDREKCIAAGMNDYLAKPVKADLLKRKLDAYTTDQSLPPSPAYSGGSNSPSVDRSCEKGQGFSERDIAGKPMILPSIMGQLPTNSPPIIIGHLKSMDEPLLPSAVSYFTVKDVNRQKELEGKEAQEKPTKPAVLVRQNSVASLIDSVAGSDVDVGGGGAPLVEYKEEVEPVKADTKTGGVRRSLGRFFLRE